MNEIRVVVVVSSLKRSGAESEESGEKKKEKIGRRVCVEREADENLKKEEKERGGGTGS